MRTQYRNYYGGVHEWYATFGAVKFGFGFVQRHVIISSMRFLAVNRERSWADERAVCVSIWRFRFGFKLGGEAK